MSPAPEPAARPGGRPGAPGVEPALTEREVELVRGTYQVLMRSGAHQLSLRTVARELGVSAPLLVYHFGSRDNLLLETVRWAVAGRTARIEGQLQAATEPWSLLDELLPPVAGECRDWFLFYLDVVQHASRHPSFAGLAEILHRHLDEAYLSLARQHAFRLQDPERAARRARAAVEGELLRWLQDSAWEASYPAVRDECRRALREILTAGA